MDPSPWDARALRSLFSINTTFTGGCPSAMKRNGAEPQGQRPDLEGGDSISVSLLMCTLNISCGTNDYFDLDVKPRHMTRYTLKTLVTCCCSIMIQPVLLQLHLIVRVFYLFL